MTDYELERAVAKIYPKVKQIPGIDKDFITKCLRGIQSLGDPEVEEKIKRLLILL